VSRARGVKVVRVLDQAGENLYDTPMMDTRDPTLPQYPIRVVVRRTGLNASVLRAWERRYGAVDPGRSEGGQRLYSEEDIRKLTLLSEVVEAGHSIGQIATLPTEELRRLSQKDLGRGSGASKGNGSASGASLPSGGGAGAFLKACLTSVHAMDTRSLDAHLNRAAMALNPTELVDELVVPLLNRIGLLWEAGEVGPASEHVATAVLRRFLDFLLGTFGRSEGGPVMIVGTPAGHRHEFGALLAAVVGAAEGWDVVLLGADLPAAEIAEATRRKGGLIVALSAIHPIEDPGLPEELEVLREQLPGDVEILIGGPTAGFHSATIQRLGVRYLPDLQALREHARQSLGAVLP
jgi:MerR family transcriptional regulator, light-induced transcriptional regulator